MGRYERWRKAVLYGWKGRCPHCGGKVTGGIHHIFPRGIKILKFIVENGIPCCLEFHRMWENPRNKNRLIKKYIGLGKYRQLENIKNGILRAEDAKFTEIK